MADLITLPYAKVLCRVANTDTTKDSLFSVLISAASAMVRTFCGWELSLASYTEYHDGRGTQRLVLHRFPVQSITSVQTEADTDSPTTYAASDVVLETETGVLAFKPSLTNFYNEIGVYGQYWPRGFQNIKVVYTAGYASIPDDVQLATALAVQGLYQHDNTALKSETIDQYSYTRREGTLLLSEEVRSLLQKYRRTL